LRTWTHLDAPGRTWTHLEDNQAAARGRWPDAAMRAKMERFWDGLSTFTGGSV
jgi:hypothetical protein